MKTIIALDCTELIVSDCDHLFLAGFNWGKHYKGYYRCSNRGTFNGLNICGQKVHWFVAQLMGLKIPEGYTIDHIDRNKLNNQRCNLRVASSRLQGCNRGPRINNTSGFVGVSFRKDGRAYPYIAAIDGKHLGSYKTPEEASVVYQEAKKLRDKEEEQRCLTLTKEER